MKSLVVHGRGRVETAEGCLGSSYNAASVYGTIMYLRRQLPHYRIRQSRGIVEGAWSVSTTLVQAQEKPISGKGDRRSRCRAFNHPGSLVIGSFEGSEDSPAG